MEDDLDPEALQEAFKFAAYSSVVLVRVTYLVGISQVDSFGVDPHLPGHNTTPPFLCADHIRSQRAHSLGRYRHFVDLLQRLLRRFVSPVRE